MEPRALAGGMAALAIVALLAGARCGFVSSDDEEPIPPRLYVTIQDHADSVTTEDIWLEGDVDCDGCPQLAWEYGSCPELACPATSSIALSWINETSGAGGPAPHGYWAPCSCSIVTGWCHRACQHYWMATVPLALGQNAIRITAVDTRGVTGDARTEVERLPPP